MKSRLLMIQLHMLVAAFFMPLMLLMPLSGGLYLFGEKGSQDKTEVFIVDGEVPGDESQLQLFFDGQFAKNNIAYSYDYIKKGGDDYLFRPTTTTHYVASREEGVLKMYKVQPNWVKRIIELHKGHGPQWFRTFGMIFALALIFVSLSGVVVGLMVPKYRRSVLITMGLGTAVVICALL